VKWNLPLEEALGFLLPRLGREMRPAVGAVFPFAEAAFQALLDRGHTGKIVVRLQMPRRGFCHGGGPKRIQVPRRGQSRGEGPRKAFPQLRLGHPMLRNQSAGT
jgi:hypothetical protein